MSVLLELETELELLKNRKEAWLPTALVLPSECTLPCSLPRLSNVQDAEEERGELEGKVSRLTAE
eukprot:scaffold10067_cov21-Tisochrysis_lutea.AAC.1